MRPEQVKTAADARRIVEERGLTHVKVGIFDVDGVLRGKYMSKPKFFSALEGGFGFCDVVLGWDSNDQLYDNVSYTGWHTAYPDAQVRIIPDSCRDLPTEGGPNAGQYQAYQRIGHQGKTLPSDALKAVNGCVQSAISQANPRSAWRYYQLVGVQGPPVDFSNLSGDLPNYYLANNVIESNDFFQSFLGTKGQFHVPGLPDGYQIGPNLGVRSRGVVYNVGGCQGCHGNSQTNPKLGFDMSFITTGFANTAEAINDFETKTDRAKYLEAIVADPQPRTP